MTYAELYAAVAALITDQSFSIRVETWRHYHGINGERSNLEVEWTIYSHGTAHTQGGTPEEALAKLHEKLSPKLEEYETSQTLDQASAAVGDASVEPARECCGEFETGSGMHGDECQNAEQAP